MKYAHITGWGKYVPPKRVTNDDLSKRMDTSDEWIRSRTGIGARHYAEGETCAEISAKAALEALDCANVSPSRVDLIIECTSSSDHTFPATGCIVQDLIGARSAGAFDLVNACAGFAYGLALAADAIKAGTHKTVLVIGAEILSRLLNFEDRGTAVLFGDGAGAVVVQASDQPGGVLTSWIYSDGSGGMDLVIDDKDHITMNGREVFKFGSRIIVTGVKEVAAKAGWRNSQINWIVPHQANVRIIESGAKSLGVPIEKFIVNIAEYGNTSAASIPIALCEAADAAKLRPNDKIVLIGFGGGLAAAAIALTWDVPHPASKTRRWFNRLGYNTSTLRQRVRRGVRSVAARFERRKKIADDLDG